MASQSAQHTLRKSPSAAEAPLPQSAQGPWGRERKHVSDQGFQELCSQPRLAPRAGVESGEGRLLLFS